MSHLYFLKDFWHKHLSCHCTVQGCLHRMDGEPDHWVTLSAYCSAFSTCPANSFTVPALLPTSTSCEVLFSKLQHFNNYCSVLAMKVQDRFNQRESWENLSSDVQTDRWSCSQSDGLPSACGTERRGWQEATSATVLHYLGHLYNWQMS